MKKLLVSSLAASLFTATVPSVHAATLGPTSFDVTVDLTAVCQIVGAPAPVLDFGTYTAFGAASVPAPTVSFDIECTRGLAAPTFTFDTVATNPTYGVLAGLNYEVTASSTVAGGAAATATLGGTGGPDVHTVTLDGAMPAGQAGACAGVDAATCAGIQTDIRTVTITY